VAEENTFYGWSLLLLVALVVRWLWRLPVVRSLTVTGVVFALLALGPTVTVDSHRTALPGPWRLLYDAPLFHSVVPTRLALVVVPVVGLLLALALRQAAALASPAARWAGRRWPATELVALAAVAAALLPVAPTPHAVVERGDTVPGFVSSGAWRDHVPPGGVVWRVPPDWDGYVAAMAWTTAADLEFSIAGGYYLVPDPGSAERVGQFGPVYPPTAHLLRAAAATGVPLEIGPEQRDQARRDLLRWRVTTVVLPTGVERVDAVRATLDELVGPGRQVADVWVWDVRGFTAA
jgi:hypothetical protein